MRERTILTRDYLWRLRNEIDFGQLFRYLSWPHKRRDGKLSFVCPECSESQTDVNPKTNLARCFRCERNWNPIDFTIEVHRIEFLEAVGQLDGLLPRNPRRHE
jgi:DNA primase